MQILKSLDTDGVVPSSKRGKHDECGVCLHDLSDLVHPAQQDIVNLGIRNLNVFNVELHVFDGLVDPTLGILNGLGRFSGDEDLRWLSACSLGRHIAIHGRERRGKVNRSVGLGLNELDVLSVSTTEQLV